MDGQSVNWRAGLRHWCQTAIVLLPLGTLALAEQPPADKTDLTGRLAPEEIFRDDVPAVIESAASHVSGPDARAPLPPDVSCAPLQGDECCPGAMEGFQRCSLLDLFGPCEHQDCWLHSDERLLHEFQKRPLFDDWTWSAGGALRYRYLDEANRLRPPLAAGRSSFSQWRFTPYLETSYKDLVTVYAQAIDASTFGNELPILAIDENRWDMLQLYVDLKAADLESGDARYRYGRQLLTYGSQHLISPLAWSNTYRNFQGHRLYYIGEDWNVDILAVQPVDGIARNVVYNVYSFDAPAQNKWLGGIYSTYKKFGSGTLDLYWLWTQVDNTAVNVLDGSRHTIGSRWAGKKKVFQDYTWTWDLEGAYQCGETSYLGTNQNVQAGFTSVNGGLTFDKVVWTPTLTGVFWWGSGSHNPTSGTNNTVSTLYPLGHAYWGLIDNFNGSNLLDFSPQVTVKPTEKLSFLTAWHWFDKAARQDAIYNILGVPIGGVTTTPANIGNELDLVATYQMNKNLQLQMGYFWFWYGDAVNHNPNPLVANRDDARQIYFYADWTF